MSYYDAATRNAIIELLDGYRKMLEQSRIASQDESYRILITDRIKKIEEIKKEIKPSPFDFLTERKIEKLQSDKYLQQQLETAKAEMKGQLRAEIAAELKKEREEKKKRKKEKKEAKVKTEMQPEELLAMLVQQVKQSSDNESIDTEDEPEPEDPSTDIDDDIPDEPLETIE